jgi:hypothetical protein
VNDAELQKKKTKRLLELQSHEPPAVDANIRQLQSEIDTILEREDLRWKQKAKQNWYRHGDHNTQYFHSWANQRRKTNSIRSISDENGHVWRRKNEVSRAFVLYYEYLFTTLGFVGAENCLNNVESRVSEEMNGRLLRPFTEVEVRSTLFQMHPLKSPGPDGYSAIFYQKS